MNHRLLILGVFTLLLTGPLNVFADQVTPGYNLGLGPLQISSQGMGQSLRSTMPPIDPGKFQTGGYRMSVGATWTNVWADEDRYLLDYEMLDTRVEISKALTERFALSVGFAQRNYFGGALDNSIEQFHDLFGIDQSGRDKASHNDSRFILYDAAGNTVRDIEDVTYADNNAVYITSQYLVYHGTTQLPAICMSGTLRYGLNTPLSEDDDQPLDMGIAIGLFKRWSHRLYSYHQLGYTRYGQRELFGLNFEEYTLFAINTLAWHWRSNLSIVLHYIYHEGALEDLGGLSDASHELDLGFRWQLSGGDIIEFALIENILTFDNSPDFGLHLAYDYRF